MDDLTSMITEFLGNEENMNQLRSVMGSLGLDGNEAASSQNATARPGGTFPGNGSQPDGTQQNPSWLPDLSGLAQLFGGKGDAASSGSSTPPIDPGAIAMLSKAASAFSREDENTQLLRALKPHFSPERAKRVDDAIRILQLIKLLPLIKEMGILGKGDGR